MNPLIKHSWIYHKTVIEIFGLFDNSLFSQFLQHVSEIEWNSSSVSTVSLQHFTDWWMAAFLDYNTIVNVVILCIVLNESGTHSVVWTTPEIHPSYWNNGHISMFAVSQRAFYSNTMVFSAELIEMHDLPESVLVFDYVSIKICITIIKKPTTIDFFSSLLINLSSNFLINRLYW